MSTLNALSAFKFEDIILSKLSRYSSQQIHHETNLNVQTKR